jgi:hypothetical protein
MVARRGVRDHADVDHRHRRQRSDPGAGRGSPVWTVTASYEWNDEGRVQDGRQPDEDWPA